METVVVVVAIAVAVFAVIETVIIFDVVIDIFALAVEVIFIVGISCCHRWHGCDRCGND